MNEQIIGRVISVDSFRVLIELDDSVKTLFKSGFNDVYEIARINSYVVIPVGGDKIVAMITKVQVKDETGLGLSENSITLPKAKRYVVATIIGTIDNSKKYFQGVYNFPILDNSVYYVLKQDLELIFDSKPLTKEIDFKKDYFLPIGKSPIFPDFDIKINPDKFFNKHVAVLGNTGSGKSCTIASILQTMFKQEYEFKSDRDNTVKKSLSNANIIIFDTNGEYKKAFEFKDEELKARVNTFTIAEEGLKVPYWFMNYDDFDYLFEPAAQTQAPVFKRAIALAKKKRSEQFCSSTDESENPIKTVFLNRILRDLKNNESDYKLRNFIYNELDTHNDFIESYLPELKPTFFKLKEAGRDLKEEKSYVDGNLDYNLLSEVYQEITNHINNNVSIAESSSKGSLITNKKHEINVDLPRYFDFRSLYEKFIDDAIDEIGYSENKYREYLSSLKLRLSSFFNDERISESFMLNSADISDALVSFLKSILGELTDNDGEKISEYRFCGNGYTFNPKNKSQIIIIDMSLLPFEILETMTALISRLLLEFVQRIEKVEGYKEYRGKFPIAIVLEEAQNYIPQIDRKKDRVSISKQVIERIAREGRKYGLSLIVSSQRPTELSKTILSQCNTFIVHRLQNPEDQAYVKELVSTVNIDLLNQLPILPQQHAIIMGDAVRSPAQVKISDARPLPDSESPEFFAQWIKDTSDIDIEKVANKWIDEEDSDLILEDTEIVFSDDNLPF